MRILLNNRKKIKFNQDHLIYIKNYFSKKENAAKTITNLKNDFISDFNFKLNNMVTSYNK